LSKKKPPLPPLQSAYRYFHSCETSLFKVFTDIESLKNVDKLSVLISLDLSSAFDTVDHSRLLLLLESKFLVKDTAVRWFKSYIKERKFCVKMGSNLSNPAEVPQGSILTSVLFVLYNSDFNDILKFYDLGVHFYGDDTQLCIDFNPVTEQSVVISET